LQDLFMTARPPTVVNAAMRTMAAPVFMATSKEKSAAACENGYALETG
jgi:hypothetical protein